MNLFFLLLVLPCMGVFPMISDDSTAPIWRGLEPGPFPVGLRVEHVFDHSRSFKQSTGDTSARPIQLVVWYPAEKSSDAELLRYEEYVLIEMTKTDFRPIEENRRQLLFGDFKKYWQERGAQEDKLAGHFEAFLSMTTMAHKDAKPADGSFPLVLYAPGGFAGANDNAILCEYLASHGFIVAACPSVGMFSEAMTVDLQGVETQVRDLEFICARLKDFPGADSSKIGTVGFSWGGLANVMLAKRNFGIDTVVSLEGAISYGKYRTLVDETPFAYSRELSVPFLLAVSGENEDEDLTFFHERAVADACLMKVSDMGHIGFSSNYILLSQFFEEGPDSKTLEPMKTGYRTICRYVLGFLNAYLKGSEHGRAFINAAPAENGVPEGVVEITWK